jgi:hypothetical protein
MHAIEPKGTKGDGFNLTNGLYLMGGHDLGLTSGPYMMWHLPKVLLHH